MEIEQPGRYHDARPVHPIGARLLRLLALEPGDPLEDPVADHDLPGALPAGRGIHQPGATDVELGDDLADDRLDLDHGRPPGVDAATGTPDAAPWAAPDAAPDAAPSEPLRTPAIR